MKLSLWICACFSMSALWAIQPAQADDDFSFGDDFFFIDDVLGELDGMTSTLDFLVDNVEDEEARADLKDSVDAIIVRLTDISDRLRPPATWYQANMQNCPQFCKQMGLNAKPSKEGALCASGENRFPSAEGGVSYKYGTWGGMREDYATTSSWGFCYGPGQKKDWDKTDRTVACSCGE